MLNISRLHDSVNVKGLVQNRLYLPFYLSFDFSCFPFLYYKDPFLLRAWKRAFFVSLFDLRLKRAVKIEASAKKINKTNKECYFPHSQWKRAFTYSF